MKLDKALAAWAKWYSRKLDRGEGYSGAEQDLFEALGCVGVPEPKRRRDRKATGKLASAKR